MIPLGSTPGSPQQGVLAQVYGVAKTHGISQIPMVGQLTLTPKFAAASHGEMGTNNDVITTQNSKNCEISFEIMKTDLFTLYNIIMDLPPALTTQGPIFVDPTTMYQGVFTMFGNQMSSAQQGSQKDIEGFLVSNCQIQSIDSAGTRDGDAKLTVKVLGILRAQVAAGGILYSRLVGSAPPYASVNPPQPTDIAFGVSTPYAAYLTKAVKALPSPGIAPTNTLIVLQMKNGQVVNPTYGLTATSNSTMVTPPAAPATTDVWDVFTVWDGTTPAM